MTDTLLALIPTYGLWLIAVCLLLSCLALPVPSSMMVMVAGGFAAAGDFAYWSLVGFAYCGFVIGDQIAFWLARTAGRPLIDRLRASPRSGKVLARAEALVQRRGALAVFLSRTVLGPLGPYVGYVAGAIGFSWVAFTATAAVAAMFWSMGYAWLGYAFAADIAQIATLISSSVGIILAGSVALGLIWWLIRSYAASQKVPPKQS